MHPHPLAPVSGYWCDEHYAEAAHSIPVGYLIGYLLLALAALTIGAILWRLIR